MGVGEEGEDIKPKLNVNIEYEGQICTMKLKSVTPFAKVFQAAEKRFNKEPGTLKFLFEGQRLRAEMTPAEVAMEDGDTIDAHLEQLGGAHCGQSMAST
ncbi:hypothetical protein FOMPIDRAFT_1052801 [Fomitopsis schrenkii]|uniref:Ubiquitin-like domain-containing protein n=1 Tax=Fomitopsis schrenkii TaxID=2126942 RepID=S8DUU7_FOMSC|nr:hypothetical protein FOMPIDRAFT_1052801 [Fomitopsis schrenkii]